MRRHLLARCLLLPVLLVAALFCLLGSAAEAGEPIAELINQRRMEMRLLHLPIDRVALGAMPVWDEKTAKLRLRVPGEGFDDSRPILILHLWATWCDPCKEEFPLWKELGERLDKQYGYDVKIIHIAMQRDAREMADFLKELGNKMPAGSRFVDRDERLSKLLQPALKREPRLPMTLWLGPARTVKQALVGSISDRVSEVMESTEQLIRLVKHMREDYKKPIPKEEEWDTFTRTAPCRCPCVCN